VQNIFRFTSPSGFFTFPLSLGKAFAIMSLDLNASDIDNASNSERSSDEVPDLKHVDPAPVLAEHEEDEESSDDSQANGSSESTSSEEDERMHDADHESRHAIARPLPDLALNSEVSATKVEIERLKADLLHQLRNGASDHEVADVIRRIKSLSNALQLVGFPTEQPEAAQTSSAISSLNA